MQIMPRLWISYRRKSLVNNFIQLKAEISQRLTHFPDESASVVFDRAAFNTCFYVFTSIFFFPRSFKLSTKRFLAKQASTKNTNKRNAIHKIIFNYVISSVMMTSREWPLSFNAACVLFSLMNTRVEKYFFSEPLKYLSQFDQSFSHTKSLQQNRPVKVRIRTEIVKNIFF